MSARLRALAQRKRKSQQPRSMEFAKLIEKLTEYGVGRRKLGDPLFLNDGIPPRLGVYDEDEENLCHQEVLSTCNIPGCNFKTETLLEFESHYNSCHRYSCSQCKKTLPSPHLLDLHVQENHDSFFAVLATKSPSYSCYIEECKEKFLNQELRREHCIKEHKLPKDFRFDQKSKGTKKNKNKKKVKTTKAEFSFNNHKQKGFASNTERPSSVEPNETSMDVNMTEMMESLPD